MGLNIPMILPKAQKFPRGPFLQVLASESALVRSDEISIKVGNTTIPPLKSGKLPNLIPGSRIELFDLGADPDWPLGSSIKPENYTPILMQYALQMPGRRLLAETESA